MVESSPGVYGSHQMWRSVAIAVLLTLLLAGCSVGGSGAVSDPHGATGTVGGSYGVALSATGKARVEMARVRLRNSSLIPAISRLRCVENGRVLVCHGFTNTGDAAVAKFRVFPDGSLGEDGSHGGAECVGWGNAKDQASWEYHSHETELHCLT